MPPAFRHVPALLVLAAFAACGGSGGDGGGHNNPPGPTGLSTGPANCVNGMAGDFNCTGLNLRKRVPFSTLGGSAGNDIWGWSDSVTGKEYALVGMTNGTAFVDVSDPERPVALGRLPTATSASAWRDIKVYGDYAYVVADGAGNHGMQVFDLRRLRGVTASMTFTADALYSGFGNAHNIAINEDSGFAYVVGSNMCNGGLYMIDLNSPASPVFAGCHDLTDTHDTQCVIYHGPDAAYVDREICFSSNENHVEIVDVTDKSTTLSLAMLVYPDTGFVHQGWLSEDHSHFYVGDELDELQINIPTRTVVLDVSDLDAPAYLSSYQSTTASTDHNLYVRGNRIYEANYSSGLRILQVDDAAADKLSEIAYFDAYPQSNAAGFDGAWSVYPYLPSGTLIVNDQDNGLFVLTMDTSTPFATAVATAFEGDTIDLEGVVAGPPVTTTWVQTGGTPASITSPAALSTTATLPNLAADEWLSFDLVVEDGSNNRPVDTVYVRVQVNP